MHLKQICVMHCIWTPMLQESFVGHNESLHLSRYFPCFMEFEGSSLFYNSLPLFPVLNLSNIVQGLISYVLKICFYLISHIYLCLPSGHITSGFSHRSHVCIFLLPYTCHMPCLSHSPLFHCTIFGEYKA